MVYAAIIYDTQSGYMFATELVTKEQHQDESMVRIGIRPTIDGRERGVRELLEIQTMSMAQSAAALISGTLKDRYGNPVECVIADTLSVGVFEASQCAEKFARTGVCASLSVTPCWCYGSETMDMDPLTPKAIWGF